MASNALHSGTGGHRSEQVHAYAETTKKTWKLSRKSCKEKDLKRVVQQPRRLNARNHDGNSVTTTNGVWTLWSTGWLLNRNLYTSTTTIGIKFVTTKTHHDKSLPPTASREPSITNQWHHTIK
jgi:hypothetical protein